MSSKIFLSVGRTSNARQEAFVQTIEHYLEGNGLVPQTVGRTYFFPLSNLLRPSTSL